MTTSNKKVAASSAMYRFATKWSYLDIMDYMYNEWGGRNHPIVIPKLTLWLAAGVGLVWFITLVTGIALIGIAMLLFLYAALYQPMTTGSTPLVDYILNHDNIVAVMFNFGAVFTFIAVVGIICALVMLIVKCIPPIIGYMCLGTVTVFCFIINSISAGIEAVFCFIIDKIAAPIFTWGSGGWNKLGLRKKKSKSLKLPKTRKPSMVEVDLTK